MSRENSIPFDAATYHKDKFHNLISTFFKEVDSGDCVELQNTLLNVYLEGDELLDNKKVVLNTTLTISFLAQLKAKWDNYVKFNNIGSHG